MHTTDRRRNYESAAIVATHGVGDAVTTVVAVSRYGLPEANPLVALLLEQSVVLTWGVLVAGGSVVGGGWYVTRNKIVQRFGGRVAGVIGGGFVITGCLLVINNAVSIALAATSP